jgi:phage gpG-like protein
MDCDIRELSRDLQAMALRVRNMRPAYWKIARLIRRSTWCNFVRGGLYPYRWKRSRRAIRVNGLTLVDTGRLWRSMTPRATNAEAAVFTKVRYAAMHQYGAPSRHTPARPFLPVDAAGRLEPSLVQDIRQTMHTWITKGKL